MGAGASRNRGKISNSADGLPWHLPKRLVDDLPLRTEEISTLLKMLDGLPLVRRLREDEVTDMLRKAEAYLVENDSDIVIHQGDDCSPGMFFLVSGSARVQAQRTMPPENPGETETVETVQLTRLRPGEIFGELSFIFGLKCTATVQAERQSRLLLIPQEYFPPSVLWKNTSGSRSDLDLVEKSREALLKWTASRRYVDIGDNFCAGNEQERDLMSTHGMLLCAMKTVPLFADWPDKVLQLLSNVLQILIFPEHSELIRQNVPATELCLLLRGSVEIVGRGDRDTEDVLAKFEVQSNDEALVLGEEGFHFQTTRFFSTRASSPCQAVLLQRHDIAAALRDSEVTEQMREDFGRLFEAHREKWRQLHNSCEGAPRRRYKAQLDVEVIASRLLELEEFSGATFSGLYSLLLKIQPKEYRPGEIIAQHTENTEDSTVTLLLSGKAVLSAANDEISEGCIIRSSRLTAEQLVRAAALTLVVHFPEEAFLDAQTVSNPQQPNQ